MKISIIGAGITGSSIGWYLDKYYPEVDNFILEASNRLGRKIKSHELTGCLVKSGPDSLSIIKPFGLRAVHTGGLVILIALRMPKCLSKIFSKKNSVNAKLV